MRGSSYYRATVPTRGASVLSRGASKIYYGASCHPRGASKIYYGASVGLNSRENSELKSLYSDERSLCTDAKSHYTVITPSHSCVPSVASVPKGPSAGEGQGWGLHSRCRKCRKCSNFSLKTYTRARDNITARRTTAERIIPDTPGNIGDRYERGYWLTLQRRLSSRRCTRRHRRRRCRGCTGRGQTWC